MRMMADYAFYTGPFGGRALSEEDFLRILPDALRELSLMTFGRVGFGGEIGGEIGDLSGETERLVAMAVCAVAEGLALQEGDDSVLGIKAERVGSHSVTYGAANWHEARARQQDDLGRKAAVYLMHTGLMDRGAKCGNQR